MQVADLADLICQRNGTILTLLPRVSVLPIEVTRSATRAAGFSAPTLPHYKMAW